jgi:hypothetical protein
VSASYAGGHENLKDLKDSLTFLVAKVRFWDVASGKEVRQVAGQEFWFAEGPEGSEGKGGQFLLSVSRGNTVLITALPPLEGVSLGQTPLDPSGVSEGETAHRRPLPPMACFKAPQDICSVRWHGATICVGDSSGVVCILQAPFLPACNAT